MNQSITNKHGDLWGEIRHALDARYDVVLWCDLLKGNTDMNLTKLYNAFLFLKDFTFSPKQRVVIYHRDTDYYVSPDANGFTIRNIYKLFNYLNIPSEHAIIVTAYRGFETESEKLAKSFNISPMQVIYCPYQWCPVPDNVNPIDINDNLINFPFVCLNHKPRDHRLYTLIKLMEQDLLDCGITSLWDESTASFVLEDTDSDTDIIVDLAPIPKGLDLHGCMHPTRINNSLILSDNQRHLFHQGYQKLHPHTHPMITGLPNQADNRYQAGFLQCALFNVVTETVGDYPYSFITEKTIKAILTKRPFVILGGRHSIKNLKDLGFKTFAHWIDESYDQHATFANRCDAAIPEIKKYCDMPATKLQFYCSDMQDVLEYNFQHYVENFGRKQVANLINNML